MRRLTSYVGLLIVGAGAAQAECAPERIVKAEDTIFSIARDELGDAAKWSLIYYTNPQLQNGNGLELAEGAILQVPCPDAKRARVDATPLRQEGAEIRLITGSRNPPFTDLDWPGQGMLTELVNAAFEDSPDAVPYSVTWENDWTQHLFPKLDNAEFDMGFPWFKPDCEAEPSNKLCTNFHFSEPVVDLVMLLFARADDPMPFADDADVVGKTLCRPAGHPTYDLDRADRRWISDGKITLRQPETPTACFEMLIAGEVDAVTVNEFLGVQQMFDLGLTKEVVPLTRPLSVEGLHVVISKKHWRGTAHLYRFNAGLAKLKQTDRYTDIVARHLGLFWDQVKG